MTQFITRLMVFEDADAAKAWDIDKLLAYTNSFMCVPLPKDFAIAAMCVSINGKSEIHLFPKGGKHEIIKPNVKEIKPTTTDKRSIKAKGKGKGSRR